MENELCPTAALAAMLDLRPDLQPDDHLFAGNNGKPITRAKFDQKFKHVLKAANLSACLLTPHSLRRGGATFALESGVPPVCIKLQGDWVSDAWMIHAIITDNLKLQTVQAFEQNLKAN